MSPAGSPGSGLRRSRAGEGVGPGRGGPGVETVEPDARRFHPADGRLRRQVARTITNLQQQIQQHQRQLAQALLVKPPPPPPHLPLHPSAGKSAMESFPPHPQAPGLPDLQTKEQQSSPSTFAPYPLGESRGPSCRPGGVCAGRACVRGRNGRRGCLRAASGAPGRAGTVNAPVREPSGAAPATAAGDLTSCAGPAVRSAPGSPPTSRGGHCPPA